VNPSRIITYALGLLAAIAAALLWTRSPDLARDLLTAAIGMLGFATTHPADAAALKAATERPEPVVDVVTREIRPPPHRR
jgi:hypothetical protein